MSTLLEVAAAPAPSPPVAPAPLRLPPTTPGQSRSCRHRTAPARPTPPGRARAAAAAPPRAAVRVTRRGQLVLVLAVSVLAVACSLLFGGADQARPPASSSSVVVAPGQTLWQLAAALAPAADRRAVVDALARANSLQPPYPLVSGQRLAVPDLP